ncbi:MAG: hypothetical protein JNL58_06405 [Planctomyces sp.]|nr:hypothetical protein [Planctomyces sp.]
MNFIDRPSMQNSPVFSSKNQKRLWLQLAVILVVIAVTALKPRIESWFGQNGTAPESSIAENLPSADDRSSEPTKEPTKEPTAGDQNDPPGSEERKLGELRDVGNNVLESTAGLRYKPGSADGHRSDHVMEHAEDQPDKRVHGVFDGGRSKVFAIIDEAWVKAKKGGQDVRTEKQNNRTVFTVRMNRRIGYVGGQDGESQDHPECRSIRIVIEGTSDIITAYPTR